MCRVYWDFEIVSTTVFELGMGEEGLLTICLMIADRLMFLEIQSSFEPSSFRTHSPKKLEKKETWNLCFGEEKGNVSVVTFFLSVHNPCVLLGEFSIFLANKKNLCTLFVTVTGDRCLFFWDQPWNVRFAKSSSFARSHVMRC